MSLLVRTPNWLGDAVMSLPAIGGILREHPDTGLWARGKVAPLFRLVFPGTVVNTFPGLSGEHRYERLLLFTSSFSSALAGIRAGIRDITGVPGDGRTPLLSSVRRIPEDRTRHHSLHYNALAALVGAEPEMPPAPLFSSTEKPHIAMFAGARYGEAKVWKGFGRVASILEGKCIFYGTDGEREYLEELAAESNSRVIAGLPFEELCRHLSAASAVLGNDSGGVHLAAFLGLPVVTVFGSTSPAWTAPLNNRSSSLILKEDTPCSPCFKKTCPLGAGEPACLAAIDPAEAVRMVMEVAGG